MSILNRNYLPWAILSVAAIFHNLQPAWAAKEGVSGFWHCDFTYGKTVVSENVRLLQKGTALTSQGYNEGVLSPYLTGTGSNIDNQIGLSEKATLFNITRAWTATFDGKNITGTVYSVGVIGSGNTGAISCRLAPEKDLGTAWTCEGPTIFYKGKVIKKKAANALLKKQIDALGSGARAKIRKTALKATKKAINLCGGA